MKFEKVGMDPTSCHPKPRPTTLRISCFSTSSSTRPLYYLSNSPTVIFIVMDSKPSRPKPNLAKLMGVMHMGVADMVMDMDVDNKVADMVMNIPFRTK